MPHQPTTHQSPPPGEAYTPCCGRTPFELPIRDRLTLAPHLVDCHPNQDGDDE